MSGNLFSVWKGVVREERIPVGVKAWALDPECLDSDLFSTV